MQSLSNQNAELLNYVSKNCAMGKSAINQLLPHVKDDGFRRIVESQYREYDEIDDLATKSLNNQGKTPEEIGAMAKISSYLMINAGTLTDDSVSHMAEMMTKGSSNGIIEITKRLNELDNVAPDVRALANRLLKSEQNNMNELKCFL